MVIIQEIISPIHWNTPPYSFVKTPLYPMNLVLSLFLKSLMDEDLDFFMIFLKTPFTHF